MKTEHYQRVRDQIGSCGIWCGSCVVGNGTLREITVKYGEIIKNYDLESWAPKTFDFKEFLKGLEAIGGMPLCQGCQKGGGWQECPMRGCVSKKKIADCSECTQPEACRHVVHLEKMRSGSLRAGLFVKMENVDRAKLLREWAIKIKTRWPSSLLFEETP
jgi:hypothetical protein